MAKVHGALLCIVFLLLSKHHFRFFVQCLAFSSDELQPSRGSGRPWSLDCRMYHVGFFIPLLWCHPDANSQHSPQVNVLMFGAANIWWVPLSNVFGRRPVILFSLLILTACSVWAAEAKSFNSLLAARVFQGIGGATADTLCPGVIGEIFFRHERGRAMVGVLAPELKFHFHFMLKLNVP